ncbi:MAG: ECF-type sigma factor [Planctomycetota bacterium]
MDELDRESLQRLFLRLQSEETMEEAAEELWSCLFDRLKQAASSRLKNFRLRSQDEEDVALSVFNALVTGVRDNRFSKLDDNSDLLQVLLMLTKRKAIAVLRREMAEKRGGGKVRGESVFSRVLTNGNASSGIANQEDPLDHWADYFEDDVQDMLQVLDPTFQQIALMRFEGKSNPEIASEIGIALRSVERKIAVIREKWTEHAKV